jgi:carboxyl-terminal processing protease
MKKIKKSLLSNAAAVILPLLIFIAISCREDDPSPRITNEENAYVNDWILENMEFWYFWNQQLPASPDRNLEPDAFFESILSPDDRFSWIQDNYQELLDALKGVSKEAGYEFVLYRESESGDNVIAQILYVKEGSPAAAVGLLRGDIISHINGQQITVQNYKSLLAEIKENHTIKYKSLDLANETFGEEKTATLNPIQYSENPNYLSKIIEVNGRKIGYHIYNLFAGGPNSESSVYDDQVDQIFADFKNAGITDLVLDLRFNSGGSESSANNLASLIGKGVNSSKIFAKREYNEGVEQAIIKDPDLGEDFLTSEFSTETANVGAQLTGSRVYILTSSRTASASELVINALKPYMEVIIIGDTTYGKNVGSISLYEENDPKNSWGMQPIVVKIYNSLGQSDYSEGFVPDILDKDNSLFIYPLGDTKEALLRHAIEHITGVSTGGRLRKAGEGKQMVGHSLDAKRSSYNLIIDQDFLK